MTREEAQKRIKDISNKSYINRFGERHLPILDILEALELIKFDDKQSDRDSK